MRNPLFRPRRPGICRSTGAFVTKPAPSAAWVLICLLYLALVLSPMSPGVIAHAATVTVTNNNDSGDGSLRQALLNVTGGGTIEFNSIDPNEITLSTGFAQLTTSQGNITIDGSNNGNSVIIKGNANVDSILTTANISSYITLKNLTLTNPGSSYHNHTGAAINHAPSYTTYALTIDADDGILNFLTNTTANSGGAIYTKTNLTLKGNANFISNSALGGGAIYFSGDSPRTLNLTAGNITFKNNHATLYGGAITKEGGTFGLTIETGSNTLLFDGNTAGGEGGGAIYARGDFSLVNGNTLFKNNAATNAAGGGAIYVNRNITLGTGNNGDIHFTGNKAASVDNAIHLNNGLMTLTGVKSIVFDDPIAAASYNSSNSFTSSVTLVQFDGSSTLSSAISGGKSTVAGGEFRVLSGASFATGGTASSASFSLSTGATLSGAGTVTTPGGITLSGIIAPTSEKYTPNSDLTIAGTTSGSAIGRLTLSAGTVALDGATLAIDLAGNSVSDTISITGNVTSSAANTVSVSEFRKGTYTIMDWTGTGFTDATNFSLSGITTNSRQDAGLSIDNNTLLLSMSAENKTLIWAGGDTDGPAIWKDADADLENWKVPDATYFINGDTVVFDATGTNKAITISGAVETAGMTVSADGYSFTGDAISGTTLALSAAGPSTTTFSNEIDFNGGITVAANNTIAFNYAPDTSNDNTISGAGSLQKQGNGVLTLSGASSYSGATTVSAGTLQIGDGGTNGSIVSPTVSVATGATLAFNRSNNLTYGGVISGAGSLLKQGAGTLTLSGASSYSGGTTVTAGLINFSTGNNLGTGNITLDGGGLQWASGNTTDVSGKLNTIGANGATFDTGGNNVAFATGLNGAGGVTKAGAGVLTLSGTNNYIGMTTVKTGILALGSNLTSSSGLTLYEGTTFRRGAFTHNLSDKTLTVFGDPTYDGDLSAQGATLNFIATGPVTGSMLNVTGAADVSGGKVNLGVLGGYRPAAGDTFSLLKAASGLTGAVTQGDGSDVLQVGATVVHNLTLASTADELTATVDGGRAAEGGKALSEGHLAGLTLTLQGADLLAGRGMEAALRSGRAGLEGGWGLTGFGTVSGGKVRYNTGSYVDMRSVSLLTGLALASDTPAGQLTTAAFFEYGNGSYDTHNSFSNASSVDGDGDTHYLGGGVLGRMDFQDTGPGHVYTEASARIGKVHNDYDSSDLRDSQGRTVDYNTSALYYGLHLGAGYVWNVTDKASLDLHAKYFWTRQEGDGVSLSTGESVRFKDADSHRLRTGARFAYEVNEHIAPYAGAAWEYEFDGKARATTNGNRIGEPDLEGSTGIGEMGLTFTPSQNLPLTFDLGVQGYTGKREGVTGNFQFKWEF